MAKPESKFIIWFEDLSSESLPQAGGKGANLGEMVSIGMPVPEGFVVNTAAFEHFVKMNKLDAKIDEILKATDVEDTAKLNEASEAIKRRFLAAEYPMSIKQEVTRAYDDMSVTREDLPEEIKGMISAGRDFQIVAVRSSATTEDLADASFAGQQASFLNVKGVPYLLDAIKRCWASLFTPRAIFYRAKKGFTSASIAVVVQKMVNGDKSGVSFTVHPSTGENVAIHEAAWGLGESIVLGRVTPDRYVANKETGEIIEKKIERKETMFVRDVGTERTVDIRVPEDKQTAQVMSEDEVRRLTALAVKLEEHYGKPQDIEWAIKGSRIYIVQTRPVTTVEAGKGKAKQKVVGGEKLLEGLAASPGIGVGDVKIIVTKEDAEKVEKGDVLVTEMTTPDLVPTMSKCVAIVTDKGGATSHAAIVSREMGIPCIVGTQKATQLLKDGDIITVDGTHGVIYKGEVNVEDERGDESGDDRNTRGGEKGDQHVGDKPAKKGAGPKAMVKKAGVKEATVKEVDDMIEELEDEFDETMEEVERDRYTPRKERPLGKTKTYMNLGVPEKIDDYVDLPFEGIGLMRVEFIIAAIGEHPNAMIKAGRQEEYIKTLAGGVEKVAAAISPRPVVVRFSDFKTNEYRDLKGGAEFEPQEENPMMGWRGVSRYVTEGFEEAFRMECKAMKRVREKHENVWLMLPFVRTTEEVERCLDIMFEEGLIRGEAGLKVWIMAEVPSVVFMAREFNKLCDGFSIGSNDLTQFVLAVDRDSEKMGQLGYFDERHLAVKMAIKHLIKEAHEDGNTVSICGQAPSQYPDLVKFLIECGIDSISVNPDTVEKTKKMIEEAQE